MPDHDPVHPLPPRRRYQFGPFALDLSRMVLTRDDVRVQLSPKVYEILVLLVTNHERVVTRDELMQAVWPDTFVEEANLTQNISVLRRVLGDGLPDGHYIETLPKRGYRFVAPVREIANAEAAPGSGAIEAARAPGGTQLGAARAWLTSRAP